MNGTVKEYPKVLVKCERCHAELGMREVEAVSGEYLEIPGRCCWPKISGGLPAPKEIETEWAILDASRTEQRVLEPIFRGQGPTGLIDVNMEWSSARDTWVFVTPRKLTAQAFDRAKANVFAYYKGIIEDFEKVGLDDKNAQVVDQIRKALLALKNNRVENIVDQNFKPDKPVSF